MIKITITDDDAIVVASLKTILEASGEVDVLATGANGREAFELFKTHAPDVTLIDIQMPVMTGLEAAEEILNRDSKAKILFLTTFADDEYIVKALNIGVKGYVLKQDFNHILPALKTVASGQSVFGTDIVSKFTTLMTDKSTFNYMDAGITEKEKEVILLVAEGLNNKEISEKLYLSEGTVRNYLSAILEKLDLRDRTQLAIWHFKHDKE